MPRFALLLISLCLLGPPLQAQAQGFGGTVALAGDQIAIGETRNSTLSGIVYLYEKQGAEWVSAGELNVTPGLRSPDGFGRAVLYGEGLLVVGAPLMDDNAGAVYLFESDGASGWNEVGRLTSPEGTSDAGFGSALGWSAGELVVSAPGEGGGAIYTFSRGPARGWQPSAPLTVVGVSTFGTRMAVQGMHMVAAAPGGRGEPTTLHTFMRTEDGWRPMGTLDVDDLPERSGFGDAFTLREGVAFVGAPGVDQRSGRVYVFDLTSGAVPGGPALTLGPTIAHANARFGAAVSTRDGEIWIGAPGTEGLGAAYALSTEAGKLSTVRMVSAAGLENGASLGANIAPSRNLMVAAASGVDEGAGVAIVYERGAEGGWDQSSTLMNAPRGFPALAGDEIHCTDGQASLFECQDVNITAFLPISALGGRRGTRVNDVWGWTDPETDVEYVIVGRTNGTSFVNIQDPYNPIYVGDLPKTEGTRTTIWRDMKVYSNHVYIVADAAGEHGVQVFDLTQLRDFDGEPLELKETFRYEGIHSAHNIVINEETGFAYAVGNSGGGETCGGGLHMINLENPAHPTFAGCYSEMSTGRRGTGYSHDAQCVVYRGPDEEHQGKEICLGSNETALNIADVTDKSAPVSIATASYPSVAYAHQGWLTEDQTFFYMNDEGDEPQGLVEGTRTLVWDVTDLDDPILVKEHIAETTATDHNLYVKGDRMYQSNYSAGFRVLDVSNPADPVEIGFLDTSPYEGGASWSNYPFFKSGVIAVTGTGDGLFLVRDMARRNLIP